MGGELTHGIHFKNGLRLVVLRKVNNFIVLVGTLARVHCAHIGVYLRIACLFSSL